MISRKLFRNAQFKPGIIIVALCGENVQRPSVQVDDLLHDSVGASHGFRVPIVVEQMDEDEQLYVNLNFRYERRSLLCSLFWIGMNK